MSKNRLIDSVFFQDIFAILATFIKQEFDANLQMQILVAFSEHDAGKGNAMLKLVKQFGTFPHEVSSMAGTFDCRDVKELLSFPGLTLVIQAIPIIKRSDFTSESVVDEEENDNRQHSLIPMQRGLSDRQSRIALERLLKQIRSIDNLITNNDSARHGGVLYLSGLSCHDTAMENSIFSESKFLPMHLLVRNRSSIQQIYHQPELKRLFKSTPATPPKIANLEQYISEIDDGMEFEDEPRMLQVI